jgi:hypothetical protein
MQDTYDRIALALVLLSRERATEGILHAVTVLEAAMPAAGTPEARMAFGMAHATLTRNAARESA